MTGEPGVRDTEYPCWEFDPGKAAGVCQSDGHYVCQECRHLALGRTYSWRKAAEAAAHDASLEEDARRAQRAVDAYFDAEARKRKSS